MVYLICSYAVRGFPGYFVTVFVWEEGSTNNQIIVSAKLYKALAVIVPDSKTMFTHYLLQSMIVRSNFGIQISYEHNDVLFLDLSEHILELFIEGVFVFNSGFVCGSIALNN
uniref:Uncharacterized protein n=1 Tax=Cacopsylla melanoneura TaxID=428564 RepID=A0A8D9FAD8_9HEMI